MDLKSDWLYDGPDTEVMLKFLLLPGLGFSGDVDLMFFILEFLISKTTIFRYSVIETEYLWLKISGSLAGFESINLTN